jgi:hypothetical protein
MKPITIRLLGAESPAAAQRRAGKTNGTAASPVDWRNWRRVKGAEFMALGSVGVECAEGSVPHPPPDFKRNFTLIKPQQRKWRLRFCFSHL